MLSEKGVSKKRSRQPYGFLPASSTGLASRKSSRFSQTRKNVLTDNVVVQEDGELRGYQGQLKTTGTCYLVRNYSHQVTCQKMGGEEQGRGIDRVVSERTVPRGLRNKSS